jgi:predicted ABC-type exoprotein transport system permease subunit
VQDGTVLVSFLSALYLVQQVECVCLYLFGFVFVHFVLFFVKKGFLSLFSVKSERKEKTGTFPLVSGATIPTDVTVRCLSVQRGRST